MANVIDRLRVQGNAAPRHLVPDGRGGGLRSGVAGDGQLGGGEQGVGFVLTQTHATLGQHREANSGGSNG